MEEYAEDHDIVGRVCELPPASNEQQRIVDALRNSNVIVDAVAGSGKTTTALHIARQTNAKILLLTYNAKLKFDTASRAANLGIYNLEVRTYHSYCVAYVNRECHTDAGIIKHLPAKLAAVAAAPCNYEIIIIDECQDMTAMYYDVARHAIAGGSPRIVVVGDRNQSIYQYKGSDPRYLTMAHELYPSPHRWARLCLSISYRITRQIADVVNSVKSPDTPRITAIKDGPKPHYMYCSEDDLAQVISRTVTANSPEDVFILAPSVRIVAGHRLSDIANKLTELRIPIYIPNSDERAPDDSVMRGKVSFVTFHQAKGLERKIVFVLSYDTTLFSAAHNVPESLPNVMYVALTRASRELYLWHCTKFRRVPQPPAVLPYIAAEDLARYYTVTHKAPQFGAKWQRYSKQLPNHVTNIVRHIPEVYSSWMLKLIEKEVLRGESKRITVPPVVLQPSGKYEEVADITGTASTAYHEIKTTGQCTIAAELVKSSAQSRAMQPKTAEERAVAAAVIATADTAATRAVTPQNILMCANGYNSYVSKLRFKIAQITNYTWATQEHFDKMSERIMDVAPVVDTYEKGVNLPGFDHTLQYFCSDKPPKNEGTGGLRGQIDMVVHDENGLYETIYEVKTVHSLTDEHYLQLLLYYYAVRCTASTPQMLLYNVLTDNLIRITVTDENLLTIMRAINHVKNHCDSSMSDAEFVSREKADKTPADWLSECERCHDKFQTL